MDLNSSLGKICLGEDVVVISSDKVEGSGDWNSLEFQDTANNGQKKETKDMGDGKGVRAILGRRSGAGRGGGEGVLGEEGLPPFVCKMGKSSRNKKRAMEKLNFFYQDIGTSSSAGGHLTQEEAAKEALTIRMSRKFALLEDERPIIETMAYHDKYKKIFDEVWKEKVELKGQVNENELANTRSDINTMPYRIYEQLGRKDMKKYNRGIIMINHTQAEAMGIFTNVLYQTMGTNDDEVGSSRSKRSRHETMEEVLLPQVHHEFLLWEGCTRDAKSRYNTRLAQLLPRHIYSPCIVNCDVLNRMDCDGEIDEMLRIRVREAESEEEIFTSVAWIRAFNINEPIYVELCHEFYFTYEFDKVCADDELKSKKIIKFRLGGRAHSLTLLEFAR
ncbi:hypothetical protein Tco_1028641, partial [Tanacetum coccineum]